MQSQTTTTPAQAEEATPKGALKVLAAGMAAPRADTPPTKAWSARIRRIYPADLDARVKELAAIETMNDRWPELLQKLGEVSPAAEKAALLQQEDGWDLDLAVEALTTVWKDGADKSVFYDRFMAIARQHQERSLTRHLLDNAAWRWVAAFRANGGSFVWGEGRARGTYRDIEGTTPRQRAYTNDLLNLAFPVDDAGQALPSPLGDAIWTEVEAELQNPVSIAAE